jgi:hypothetical protein
MCISYYKFVQRDFLQLVSAWMAKFCLGSSQPLCVTLSLLYFNVQKKTRRPTSLVDTCCLETVSGALGIL